MKSQYLNREENYLVKATLTVNGNEIGNVPCKVYLPERIYEKPLVVFKPEREDAPKILGAFCGGLKAFIYGFDSKIQTTIEAPEVYLAGVSTKYWGDDISESTVPGDPQHLRLIHHRGNSDGPDKTLVTFWISPNEYLTPPTFRTLSYLGEIKVDRIRPLEFSVKDGVRLKMDRHFGSRTVGSGDLVQWPYLVACAELDVPAHDVEALRNAVLEDIDDFLLIASFALRKRTACLGWTATDRHSHTTYYRGSYSFPDCIEKKESSDGLVNDRLAEEFIEKCYASFGAINNKLALRNALVSAVPLHPQPIETSFLSRFAGLETLILEFKRQEKLEFILEKPKWKSLKTYLEKCVKASVEPKLEVTQRKSIYDKLGELNRVSLREAFDMFCGKYGIYLSDLWPVFGEEGIVGLVEIRNKLIHGDPFPHDFIGPLAVANEQLQLTLERVLVKILGWGGMETTVSPTYLKMHVLSMKELPSAQARLYEYFHPLSDEKSVD